MSWQEVALIVAGAIIGFYLLISVVFLGVMRAMYRQAWEIGKKDKRND